MTALPHPVEPLALNATLLALLQLSGAALALKDERGAYLWASEAWASLLGVAPERLPGHTDLDLLALPEATALRAADQRALAAGGAVPDSHRFERAGAHLDLRTWRMPLQGANGQPQLLTLCWDDSQAHQQAAQLQSALQQIARQQAAFDKLERLHNQGLDRPTALFRHEQFEDHLRRELALSQREHREFAIALMALDGFEALCQARGRAAADQAVETVGQLLRSNTRAMDVITRLSDDRYAVLLSGVGLATAHTRMEQLRRQCATHIVVHDAAALGFEVSVGVASFPHTADTQASLSAAAERALLDARQRGGNRVALASITLGKRPVPQPE